jgi:protein-disulfide isomerase
VSDVSSRAEEKARLRREREEAERKAAQAAARKRRLTLLGGVLVAALAIIAVVVVISRSGTDEPASAAEGQARANTLFEGIPQTGNVLGDPDAPVTIEEFVDLQCPFCKRFSETGLPELVEEYVKTGQVKIVLQTLTFLGADSERGARVAWSASEQGRMFQFVESFFANQGQENSGYADEAFLERIAGGVTGLDAAKALDGRDSAKVSSAIQASQASATESNVRETPSFLVGPSDGELSRIESRTLTVDDFREPIADALAEAKAGP